MMKILLLILLMFLFAFNLNAQNKNEMPSHPDEVAESKAGVSLRFHVNYNMSQDNGLGNFLNELDYNDDLKSEFLSYGFVFHGISSKNFLFGFDFSFQPNRTIEKNSEETFEYGSYLIKIPFGYRIQLFEYISIIPNIAFSIADVNAELRKGYSSGEIDIDDLLYDDNLEVISFHNNEFLLNAGLSVKINLGKNYSENRSFMDFVTIIIDGNYNYCFYSPAYADMKDIDDIDFSIYDGIQITAGVGFDF